MADLTPPNALAAALARVLRPLVRLAVARGITYPALAEILKLLYVDVARRDFPLPEAATPSDSRVNLLTGIHRKELKRLREAEPDLAESMPESVSLGARLVAVWTSTPPFVDAEGRPRPLARLDSAAPGVSFEALVTRVSKDIRSRVVLDEWLRLGVANLNPRDEVELRAEAFIPSAGFEEKLFYFGHNLRDHAAAATGNLLGEAPAHLERSVHYDALTPASIAELQALCRRLGMETLHAVNAEAMRLEARDATDPAARARFTYGIYFYAETPDTDDSTGEPG